MQFSKRNTGMSGRGRGVTGRSIPYACVRTFVRPNAAPFVRTFVRTFAGRGVSGPSTACSGQWGSRRHPMECSDKLAAIYLASIFLAACGFLLERRPDVGTATL
jgi:hypothetical protein